ncbi:MAG: DegT/DnrJ/EryC1/StrS family aminotransferase, partial [Nitrososphaera sp.]
MATDDKRILLATPVVGQEEKLALCRIIDSGWLTMGEHVSAFEEAFARLHGAGSAIATGSCTAGLHMCLAALDIGPGDEVLVPSLTFVATVNAVLHVGATPVFVDIEQDDLPHMSLADAETKCTHKTKAAIIMHYGGYLMDTRAWRSFTNTYNLRLIEDAAHAPGSDGIGHWSDAAVFGFFSNKNMTTAEGGMIIGINADVRERIRSLRTHGMTTDTLKRDRGHAYSYDVTLLGYNYRMDELRAAVGITQLPHLTRWNARRRELSALYRQRLAQHVPDIVVPFSDDWKTAAHLMPILLPMGTDRHSIMECLNRRSIQTSIHYPPVHQFSYYRRRFPSLRVLKTESFCEREMTLPLHPLLE